MKDPDLSIRWIVKFKEAKAKLLEEIDLLEKMLDENKYQLALKALELAGIESMIEELEKVAMCVNPSGENK